MQNASVFVHANPAAPAASSALETIKPTKIKPSTMLHRLRRGVTFDIMKASSAEDKQHHRVGN
jgi:hypothetical protein